jgi:transcriptional regulator with XRE-family HTH domain
MNQEFPRIITILRKEKGITQKQAAADLGVSQAMLSHYEKGIRECGLDFLVRIADYYDVSTDYLLGRSISRKGESAVESKEGDETHRFNGSMVNQINRKLLADDRHCIYIGPGRWGSSDPWLGIPVKWPNISAARVIVEAGLDNFQVDPSQGTHFFQNLTSLGVSYLTINAFKGDGLFDEARLNALPAVEETDLVRHVRLDSPLTIKVDGIHREAVVMLSSAN